MSEITFRIIDAPPPRKLGRQCSGKWRQLLSAVMSCDEGKAIALNLDGEVLKNTISCIHSSARRIGVKVICRCNKETNELWVYPVREPVVAGRFAANGEALAVSEAMS